VARGGSQQRIGGGPVRHTGLNKLERLVGPSAPSLATQYSRLTLAPRLSKRAERRNHMRLANEHNQTAATNAAMMLENGAGSPLGSSREEDSSPGNPSPALSIVMVPNLAKFTTGTDDPSSNWNRISRPGQSVRLSSIRPMIAGSSSSTLKSLIRMGRRPADEGTRQTKKTGGKP
jgi:hypothetical protein